MGENIKAARMYSMGKLVVKAIECYEQEKMWEAILQCIKDNENEFNRDLKESLIQKYVPKALSSLYSVMAYD